MNCLKNVIFCSIPQLKNKVIDILKIEAEQYLGMSMTYSLFEFIKEKFDDLIEEQPNDPEKLEVEKLCIAELEPQVCYFLLSKRLSKQINLLC